MPLSWGPSDAELAEELEREYSASWDHGTETLWETEDELAEQENEDESEEGEDIDEESEEGEDIDEELLEALEESVLTDAYCVGN